MKEAKDKGVQWYIERTIQVIEKDIEHQYHDRTEELAELYRKLTTGEKIETLMRQFVRREDAIAFKQRCDITQHITSVVCQNLMKPCYKVPRTNSSTRILGYANNDEQRLKEIQDILAEFTHWGDLDDWMSTRFIELQFTDPNTWVVLLWEQYDSETERASPYPFEVNSEMCKDYAYESKVLNYLLTESEEECTVEGIKKELYTYTTYTPNNAITFKQTFEKDILSIVTVPNQIKQITRIEEGVQVTYEAIRINDSVYLISVYDHLLGYVPAFRVGYCRDIVTDGNTFVSPIHEATPILMNLIAAKSELDLTIKLHTFPQKIQFVPHCDNHDCSSGHLPDGSMCGTCHGSGMKISTTAQDAITIPMALSGNKEEMVDLNNLVTYVTPDVGLIKFQAEYIQQLIASCKEAVYNSDIYSKQEISTTATGKNISLQNVYDTLYPMAIQFSRLWSQLVYTVADITDLSDGLIASYTFSRDFKLKGLDELYADLATAYNSNADDFIKRSIQDDIARVLYSDNQKEFVKYQVRQSFYPFSGKTPEQIALIMAQNSVPKEKKVLWSNFGWLFDELEQEQYEKGLDFYAMTKEMQTKLINEKIAAISASMPVQQPTFFA